MRQFLLAWLRPSNARWLRHTLWIALVLASGIHLCQAILLPFETAVLLLASRAVTAHAVGADDRRTDALAGVAIVAIDDTWYQSRYRGVSPLDRCVLADDLSSLLMTGVQTVAVDFLLTPTDRHGAEEERCQKRMERVLDQYSARLVLISSEAEISMYPDWFSARRHMAIGDASVHENFGMVSERQDSSKGVPTFPDLIRHAICKAGIPANDRFANECVPDHAEFNVKEHRGKSPAKSLIHFEHLKRMFNEGDPMTFPRFIANCTASNAKKCSMKADAPLPRLVIFGGSYGEGDQFVTPIGKQSGMLIHAAMASQQPRHFSHLWGYLIDIAFGMCIAAPVHWLWHHYFTQRVGYSTGRFTLRVDFAWVWLLLLVCLWGVALFLAILGTIWLLDNFGIWVNPVPIAVGMALDCFVLGSVSVATHLLHSTSRHGSAAVPELTIQPLSDLILRRKLSGALVPRFVALAIAVIAVYWLSIGD